MRTVVSAGCGVEEQGKLPYFICVSINYFSTSVLIPPLGGSLWLKAKLPNYPINKFSDAGKETQRGGCLLLPQV